MSIAAVIEGQVRWAIALPRRGHVLDRIENNLFLPLHPATLADFARGAGDELGRGGGTAKMRSLRSSSALACNVFDPWRGVPLGPLAAALELDGQYTELAFEQKLPHGLKGISPNLDVMLFGRTSRPAGIEGKFCEPYDHTHQRPALDAKYFPAERRRWAEVGLPRAQRLAEAVGSSVEFIRLDAGQLLKHSLALATTFPHSGPICLRYVWFDSGRPVDTDHKEEIARFSDAIEGEIDFQAVSYNEVFARLSQEAEPQAGYLAYLRARYFAA